MSDLNDAMKGFKEAINETSRIEEEQKKQQEEQLKKEQEQQQKIEIKNKQKEAQEQEKNKIEQNSNTSQNQSNKSPTEQEDSETRQRKVEQKRMEEDQAAATDYSIYDEDDIDDSDGATIADQHKKDEEKKQEREEELEDISDKVSAEIKKKLKEKAEEEELRRQTEREVVNQTARHTAENEIARKSAEETARRTTEETARAAAEEGAKHAAQETTRKVAQEEAAKKVGEGVFTKAIAGLWMYILIGVAIIIGIILVIGYLSYFSNYVGIVRDKIDNLATDLWTKLKVGVEGFFVGQDKAQVKEEDVLGIANYLDSMGYDLPAFGFLDNNGKAMEIEYTDDGGQKITANGKEIMVKENVKKKVKNKNEETGEETEQETEDLEITKIKSKYLLAYLAADENTYMISNDNFNMADFFENWLEPQSDSTESEENEAQGIFGIIPSLFKGLFGRTCKSIRFG